MLLTRGGIQKFSTCVGYVRQSSFEIKRQSRMLDKILTKAKGKRERTNFNNAPFIVKKFQSHGAEYVRMTALNKIFMEQINQMFDSLPQAEILHNYGIEITQVKIKPSYQALYVFWTHTKPLEDEEKVEQILSNTASTLRAELTSMNIISHSPIIYFTKDKAYSERVQLENVFNVVSQELETFYAKDDNQISRLREERKLPLMAENTLGLDRALILSSIIDAKQEKNGEDKKTTKCKGDPMMETYKFDKKELSRVVFNKMYQEKKMLRKERENLLREARFSEDEEEEEEDEESDDDFIEEEQFEDDYFQNDEDYEPK